MSEKKKTTKVTNNEGSYETNDFEIEFNYDSKGHPKGEKLKVNGKKVPGNGPVGVEKFWK